MKKRLLLVIATMLCVAFSSCYKESEYSIKYIPNGTDIANVTVFEYDYSYELVKIREIKYIEPNVVYPMVSSDLAHYLVIGVEGTVNQHITEWYSGDVYELDSKTPIHIDVDFRNMNTQGTNPVNPADCVQRYLRN